MHRSKCLSRLLYSLRGILPTWQRTPTYGCKHTRVLVYHPACRTPSRARPAHYYAHSKTRREILALFVDHQNLSGYSCLLHCLKNRCLLSNEIQQNIKYSSISTYRRKASAVGRDVSQTAGASDYEHKQLSFYCSYRTQAFPTRWSRSFDPLGPANIEEAEANPSTRMAANIT